VEHPVGLLTHPHEGGGNLMTLKGIVVLVFPAMLLIQTAPAQEKYSGTKLCASCHKGGKGGTAYTLWSASRHAKAFETLKSEGAKKIAKERGMQEAPHESAACLECHVTGGGTASNITASFKKEEGVTCEACHGPSSGYKMVHAKGDVEKSKAAGLIEGDTSGKSCLVCHNEKSPTYKSFNFEERWARIKHALPESK